MGILEKISEIEKEIARTQKNKGEPRPDIALLHLLTYFFDDIIQLRYAKEKQKYIYT